MSDIGKPERETQDRVIALFRDVLGCRYLGDWSDRSNRNVEALLARRDALNRLPVRNEDWVY